MIAQRYGRTPPLPSIHRFEKLPTVTGGHCWGVMASGSAGLMTIVKVPVAVCPRASVALTVNVLVCALVGVPTIATYGHLDGVAQPG